MVNRRDFISLAGIGGTGLLMNALGGKLNASSSIIDSANSMVGASKDLYQIIKLMPVDDTHCHPLTFSDSQTTPNDFVERFALSAFPISLYFPTGIYDQWKTGDSQTKQKLDRKYKISEKRNEMLFHAKETVFIIYFVKSLADFLNCDPTLDSVIEARNKKGKNYSNYLKSLFKDANIENVMLDMGYREGLEIEGLNRFKKAIAPTKGRHILRVDTILKDLMAKDISFNEIETKMVADIKDGLDGIGNLGDKSYGMKSYLLPRLGLFKPLYDRDIGKKSWIKFINAMKNGSLPSMHGGDRDENWEIRKDALRYLHSLALEMCMERDMPMQFHAGDGEPPRGILRNQDPFDMEEMIRFDKDGLIRTPKIILIHAGYPNIGKAAWISHLYTNCYFEISLATPLIHQGMLRMYLEAMEVVPLTKILFGSDAYHIPEFYWLAAKWGRIFLSQALGVYVDAKIMTEDEAVKAAKRILFQNNRRVYNL